MATTPELVIELLPAVVAPGFPLVNPLELLVALPTDVQMLMALRMGWRALGVVRRCGYRPLHRWMHEHRGYWQEIVSYFTANLVYIYNLDNSFEGIRQWAQWAVILLTRPTFSFLLNHWVGAVEAGWDLHARWYENEAGIDQCPHVAFRAMLRSHNVTTKEYVCQLLCDFPFKTAEAAVQQQFIAAISFETTDRAQREEDLRLMDRIARAHGLTTLHVCDYLDTLTAMRTTLATDDATTYSELQRGWGERWPLTPSTNGQLHPRLSVDEVLADDLPQLFNVLPCFGTEDSVSTLILRPGALAKAPRIAADYLQYRRPTRYIQTTILFDKLSISCYFSEATDESLAYIVKLLPTKHVLGIYKRVVTHVVSCKYLELIVRLYPLLLPQISVTAMLELLVTLVTQHKGWHNMDVNYGLAVERWLITFIATVLKHCDPTFIHSLLTRLLSCTVRRDSLLVLYLQHLLYFAQATRAVNGYHCFVVKHNWYTEIYQPCKWMAYRHEGENSVLTTGREYVAVRLPGKESPLVIVPPRSTCYLARDLYLFIRLGMINPGYVGRVYAGLIARIDEQITPTALAPTDKRIKRMRRRPPVYDLRAGEIIPCTTARALPALGQFFAAPVTP